MDKVRNENVLRRNWIELEIVITSYKKTGITVFLIRRPTHYSRKDNYRDSEVYKEKESHLDIMQTIQLYV